MLSYQEISIHVAFTELIKKNGRLERLDKPHSLVAVAVVGGVGGGCCGGSPCVGSRCEISDQQKPKCVLNTIVVYILVAVCVHFN